MNLRIERSMPVSGLVWIAFSDSTEHSVPPAFCMKRFLPAAKTNRFLRLQRVNTGVRGADSLQVHSAKRRRRGLFRFHRYCGTKAWLLRRTSRRIRSKNIRTPIGRRRYTDSLPRHCVKLGRRHLSGRKSIYPIRLNRRRLRERWCALPNCPKYSGLRSILCLQSGFPF